MIKLFNVSVTSKANPKSYRFYYNLTKQNKFMQSKLRKLFTSSASEKTKIDYKYKYKSEENLESIKSIKSYRFTNTVQTETKIDHSIFEDENFLLYSKVISIGKYLATHFDLNNFRIIVGYISKNLLGSNNFLKDFEGIFVRNLNMIDYKTKIKCVEILSREVNTRKIPFEEENWMIILKDFEMIAQGVTFKDFFDYAVSLRQVFVKKNFNKQSKYNSEFVELDCKIFNILNSKKVKMRNIDDLTLFSRLILSTKEQFVSLRVWKDFDKIVKEASIVDELSLKEVVLVASVILEYKFFSRKVEIIFQNSIKEVNDYLKSILINYHFIEINVQQMLNKNADTIFTFYLTFNKVDSDDPSDTLIPTLISIYSQQMKLKRENSNLDTCSNQEFLLNSEILYFLSSSKYNPSPSFWSSVAAFTTEFINRELSILMEEVFPRKAKKKNLGKSFDYNYPEENKDVLFFNNLMKILYIFSYADYTEYAFWSNILEKVTQYNIFYKKDAGFVMNFIATCCMKISQGQNFAYKNLWEGLIDLMDSSFRRIFNNPTCLAFLCRERDVVLTEDIETCLNSLLFSYSQQDIAQKSYDIRVLSQLFILIEDKIVDNHKALKLFPIKLIDIIKSANSYNEPNFDLHIQLFQSKLKASTSEKINLIIKQHIKEQISEEKLTEEDIVNFKNLLTILIKTNYLSILDIEFLKYSLQKEKKLTPLMKTYLFDKLMEEIRGRQRL